MKLIPSGILHPMFKSLCQAQSAEGIKK